MNWKLIKKISLIGIVLLLASFLTNLYIFLFIEYHGVGVKIGCYATDAMLVGFECKGFWGSNIVSAWLNWPLSLLYSILFIFFNPIALFVVWSPVIMYIASAIKLRKEKMHNKVV